MNPGRGRTEQEETTTRTFRSRTKNNQKRDEWDQRRAGASRRRLALQTNHKAVVRLRTRRPLAVVGGGGCFVLSGRPDAHLASEQKGLSWRMSNRRPTVVPKGWVGTDHLLPSPAVISAANRRASVCNGWQKRSLKTRLAPGMFPPERVDGQRPWARLPLSWRGAV